MRLITSKKIIIIDPLSGGHHEEYISIYKNVLEDLGFKIDVIRQSQNFDTKIFKLPVFGSAFMTVKRWYAASNAVRKKINKDDKIPFLVIFLWLDSYLNYIIHSLLIDVVFPYDWFGLYFHPRHLRIKSKFNFLNRLLDPDSILHSRHCKAVGVLDLGIIEKLQSKVPNKPVISFPDVIDTTVVGGHPKIISDIVKKSKGKKIVGIFGSLDKRKGVLTAIELAKKYNEGDIYFVFVGEYARETFSKEEQKIILDFVNKNPDNCYFFLKRIKSNKLFNSLIAISDLLFLEYINFPHSSGLIMKSAYFKKPVIVNNGYYMAEIVKKYGIGKIVKQGDIESTIRAIKSLLYENDFYPEGFTKLYKDNSIANLKFSLINVINVIKNQHIRK